MPDVQFTSSWTKEEMKATQDNQIINILSDYNSEIEVEWNMFKKVIIKYPEVFPGEFVGRGIFMNVYAQICTRCFGFGLTSTGMVPMGDNLNHSSVDITIELVNTRKHIEAFRDPHYFKIGKYLNDYTSLFENTVMKKENINIDDLKDEETKLNIKGRFN